MTHRQILDQLSEVAIVPIIRTADSQSAIAAVHAIAEGGIPCVEITMTVNGAVKVLEAVADRYGDTILLGAGTVLDGETARICMLAGAQFLVTPSLNTRTIEMARRYGKPVFSGALTPTEILTAWESGADAVKVFPCSSMGGASYIKALKGPFPQISLLPTGGVNLSTIADFFRAGAWAVGVGGELVDAQSCQEGNYSRITSKAGEFASAVRACQAR